MSQAETRVKALSPCKPKTCKACGDRFTPDRPLQVVCSVPCSWAHVAKENAKTDRRLTRAAKAKLKTRRDWLREAQAAVNSYVRARDARHGCVSCDKPASWDGQWHASHFRSVGAASSVRFNLWNIHKSCSVCNNFKSGNLGEYAPRLRAKIGDEKVDWIYAQNTPVTYSIEYLQRLKKVFTKKAKRLLSRNKA